MFAVQSRTRTVEAALRDLSAEKPDVRASAAADLGVSSAAHDRVVVALIEALDDVAAEVRDAAALSLADLEAQAALPALLDAARDGGAMALAALGELALQQPAAALKVALAKLDHRDPRVRYQAAMAACRLSSDETQVDEVLLRASRDRDPLIRHIAIRMAEEVAEEAGRDVVSSALMTRCREMVDTDSDDTVCVAAAVVLGRAGETVVGPILTQVASRELRSRELGDEAAAIELCGTLGVREAIEALEKRAFSRVLLLRNDPFAWQARVALAQLGHSRAQGWIMRELRAWTRERRTLAVAAAGRAQLKAARGQLEVMLGDDKRVDQYALQEALALLDGKEPK